MHGTCIKIFVNLLEIRKTRMFVCIRYIGAMDRSLVPTRGSDIQVVETSGVIAFLLL